MASGRGRAQHRGTGHRKVAHGHQKGAAAVARAGSQRSSAATKKFVWSAECEACAVRAREWGKGRSWSRLCAHRKVNLLRSPKRGLSLLVHLPDPRVLDREEHKALLVLLEEWLVGVGGVYVELGGRHGCCCEIDCARCRVAGAGVISKALCCGGSGGRAWAAQLPRGKRRSGIGREQLERRERAGACIRQSHARGRAHGARSGWSGRREDPTVLCQCDSRKREPSFLGRSAFSALCGRRRAQQFKQRGWRQGHRGKV